MRPVVVEMRGIVKRFPGVIANNGVNLEVREGQIHALLGENGAGKSTLMNILTGLYHPDQGVIRYKGNDVRLRSPKDAIELGIGMIHQHFRLVQTFTVAENIILGLSKGSFVLDMASVERDVDRISRAFGLAVNPSAKIWQLSVGEQQRVEIVKALYRGAQVLIMDEPTAVLTPQEVKELFTTLKAMTKSGKSIIFITHKLDEVMEIADTITVLRGGVNVATTTPSQTSRRELATLMVGRELAVETDRPRAVLGDVTLSVSGLTARGDRGQMALKGLDLEVRGGEILGIAGVAGNGQRELAEVVTGLRKAEGGKVFVCGKDMTNRPPIDIIRAGVSHIPEDRLGTGLAPNLGITDNAVLKEYRRRPISAGPFIVTNQAATRAKEFVDRFSVKTPSLATPVRLLSGGNSQRLVLARETSCQHNLIIAVHPTRGLDIGATRAVRSILLSQRSSGSAVLLISEDLEELMELSDRIAVVYEGRIMGVVEHDAVDLDKIGLMMAGVEVEANEDTH